MGASSYFSSQCNVRKLHRTPEISSTRGDLAGKAVIDGLLAPVADGSPSPYAVRALTRDPSSRRAQALIEQGVECVKGAFDDFSSVQAAFEGVYGAFVNTDGFTVGEQKEIYAGIRIFEIAKMNKGVRHYVWSNLDYALKISNYDPIFCCEHTNGKGRVGDFIRAQRTEVSDTSMTWSMVTTTPYMDMLSGIMFGPLNRRPDGTVVFASPIGKGHVPMIALTDIGYFARYTFDHRTETSGQELLITSDIVGWDYLVETFQNVTGEKAVVVHQPLEEWFKNFNGTDRPIANERATGDGSTTWKQNFTGWWAMWQNDLLPRDMNWIRSIHPQAMTLERWMREQKYDGTLRRDVLKNAEDAKSPSINFEVTSTL